MVSIVIPNHNYAGYLPGCLDSIRAQNMDTRCLEVLFVDDASTDGSLDLARRLVPKMDLAAWRVFGVPRAGRPGPVRNAGLAQARGRFLLTLDPDDELLPDFLPQTVRALEAGADVAYPDYLREEAGHSGPESATAHPVCAVPLRDYHKLLLANQNILPPTALFRRDLWERGARFRHATLYEDWDFWIQLALLGARFAHVTEPLYLHRAHAGSFSAMAHADDDRSKARLVVDNPVFFPSWTRTWARGVLCGASASGSMGRGVIPVLPEHAARHTPR
ncbi:MAG: hypothetical protein AUJ49_09415 [Desulfovibrionaceae bacterium CG1_02_65_16]|nr:MAG: hypothetical protein AUJ49_09415 [Desulfovibrionaceae bacterium CG1_02_65_16]